MLSLAERLEVEAALEGAFAPLRARRSDLSPLRVRAAVRWGRGRDEAPPAALRWSGALRRLSELSVAVGMTVLVFGAALDPVRPAGTDALPSDGRPARGAGPSLEVQREVLVAKQERSAAIRERFDAWLMPLQDLLIPDAPRQAGGVPGEVTAPWSDPAHPEEPH